jgi:hypothetical protein
VSGPCSVTRSTASHPDDPRFLRVLTSG